jgi:hypothetical protein
LATLVGCGPLLLTAWPDVLRVVLSTVLFAAIVLVTRAFPAELADLLPARLGARLVGR